MKVLQICLKPPLPEIDGGCKAMNNITQGLLQNGVAIKIVTLSTYKHPFNKEELPEEYCSKTNIEHVYIDTKVKAIDAFLNLFSSKSYNIERFYSKKFEDLIVAVISKEKFDVIFLESLYVSKYVPAIRKNTNAKIIYRAHNIESEIWQRNAMQEKGFKKNYLNLLAKKLRNYEQNSLNQFDGIAAITAKDKNNLQKMGATIPIEVIPFGIDLNDYKIDREAEKNSIFHIGSMDWKPNQNGIKWFFDHVWDSVVEQRPESTFNLAGKDMPDWLLNHEQKNVRIVGKVKNANDFISQNLIMIVPLFVASGMRIKIIEGMALGKLIIASSIAAEGISYKNGENIIIANTDEEFISALVNYIEDEEAQQKIGTKARELIESTYDNRIIVNNLVQFFKSI